MRAHTCSSDRHPAAAGTRSTRFALAWEQIAANEGSPQPVQCPPLALRNDGREHVWQREIRTLSGADERRQPSTVLNVRDVRLSARGNECSHAQSGTAPPIAGCRHSVLARCSNPNIPHLHPRATPRCDWRNAAREILLGAARGRSCLEAIDAASESCK